MLKKFGMNEAKAISTPMGTNGNLDSDASGNMVDQKLYRSIIGSYRRNLVGSLPRGMPTVVDELLEVCVRKSDGDTERKRQ